MPSASFVLGKVITYGEPAQWNAARFGTLSERTLPVSRPGLLAMPEDYSNIFPITYAPTHTAPMVPIIFADLSQKSGSSFLASWIRTDSGFDASAAARAFNASMFLLCAASFAASSFEAFADS